MTLERRTPLKRSQLRRHPKPSTTDRELARAWFDEVTSVRGEHEGRCVMCGRSKRDGRLQGHHTIRQQAIERAFPHGALWDAQSEAWVPVQWEGEATRRTEEIRWDPSNGVPLCVRCHDDHTDRRRRVPYERLGDGPRFFALTHRDRFGTNFELELEREHPRERLEPLQPLREDHHG